MRGHVDVKVLHTLNAFEAFLIQVAKCMCHIVLSSMASPLPLPYFATLSQKPQDFLKKKILYIKFEFSFSRSQ